jgi:hypothetical protein
LLVPLSSWNSSRTGSLAAPEGGARGRLTTLAGALALEYERSAEASFPFRELLGRSLITGPMLLTLLLLLLAPRGPPEPGATFSDVWLTAPATTELPVVGVAPGSLAGDVDGSEVRYGPRGRDPATGI